MQHEFDSLRVFAEIQTIRWPETFHAAFSVVNLGLEAAASAGYDFAKLRRPGLEADDSAGFEGLGYTEHEGFDKRSHEEEEEEVTSWVPRGLAVLLREVRDLWLWGWVGGRGFVKGGCMVLEQLGFREDGVLGGLCQR